MENITFGSLYNNLEAKIQKMKKCPGLRMIWQSESQYQDAGGAFAPPGSKGCGVENKGFLELVTTYNQEQLQHEQQNWRSRLC